MITQPQSDGSWFSRGLFPEWKLIGDVLSYGLYRRWSQEHITAIERIPDPRDFGGCGAGLKAAKDFKAAGVPVTMVFHGIGVTWLTAFAKRDDKFSQAYGSLFDEVRDTIGGACNFSAATRFGAGESAKRLGVPLLGDPGDHHSVAALVADGYTPIIL